MVIMAGATTFLFNEVVMSSSMILQFTASSVIAGILYLALAGFIGLIDLQDMKRLPLIRKWFVQ
ncbi:hypothetical protein D3C76_1755980 [compost metagenome]